MSREFLDWYDGHEGPISQETFDSLPWRQRMWLSSQRQFHAIVSALLNQEPIWAKESPVKYVSRFTVTSDGFLLWSFIDQDGQMHQSAFVGPAQDIAEEMPTFAEFCNLTADERREWYHTIMGKLGDDYSGRFGSMLRGMLLETQSTH